MGVVRFDVGVRDAGFVDGGELTESCESLSIIRNCARKFGVASIIQRWFEFGSTIASDAVIRRNEGSCHAAAQQSF